MVGVITRWDILAHPAVTIQCFGWRLFFRAMVAGNDRTFLSLLQEAASPTTEVPDLLGRCIDLELRARRIYKALARALEDQGLVGPFFEVLARQERLHADLLGVCRSVALRGAWKANLFNPWKDYLPRLELQMEETEAKLYEVNSVDAALRLVLRIEGSEINQVFHAALAATDAAFVRRLRPFRDAMETHMGYILDRLPELAPHLVDEARALRAKFPQARTDF